MERSNAVRLSCFVLHITCIGLIGLAFGFLGSFFVQSSCHFLTATVVVGGNAEQFDLHYGLWKYTPLSSAFEGTPTVTSMTVSLPLILLPSHALSAWQHCSWVPML